jgi:predicted adenine nucleotide alpha hydrolase (AANH) superfamily ATPase
MDDLFLHACCGPCCTVAVPAWRDEGFEPTLYYYNPNIQPVWEYAKRLAALRTFASSAACELVLGANDHLERWLAVTDNGAARGATRCGACFSLRLDEAARAARARGFTRFATTLTVSPYQDHELIRHAGEAAAAAAGVTYLHLDLRPSFTRSYAESRRLGLYRQSYCGCVPSKWEARLAKIARQRRRDAR